MIFLGLIVGIFTGNGEEMSNTIVSSINSTITFTIGFIGLMCFWCGVMKIAQNSGFTEKLAKIMKPILKLIFKDASKDEKALGAIVMNITANMMGLGNAATPFGIKAMEEMDRLNSDKSIASNDMALFLVINSACIQLIPSTVLSIRAAAESTNPGIIIIPSIISTGTAAIVGVICCKILQRYF